MSDKNGKLRSKCIDSLTEDDATMLRRLVDEHVPAGTSAEASLLISRLIANIGQRERTIGQLAERLDRAEARLNVTENTIRSMRGNGVDARSRANDKIKRAARGAAKAERGRVVRYIRNVGENECGLSQTDCDDLAERIERGLHLPQAPDGEAPQASA